MGQNFINLDSNIRYLADAIGVAIGASFLVPAITTLFIISSTQIQHNFKKA